MCYCIAGVYDYAGAIATLQPRKKEKKKKSLFHTFPDRVVFIIMPLQNAMS